MVGKRRGGTSQVTRSTAQVPPEPAASSRATINRSRWLDFFPGVTDASSSGLHNRAYAVMDDAAAGGSFSGPTRMLPSSILTA
jgi:hypothetical protein